MIVLQLLFWGSLFLVLYTYLLYPGLLLLWTALKPGRRNATVPETKDLPPLSVVTSLFNEEAVLEEKVKNLRDIDYPPEKIEFLFGSDGSTDRSVEILEGAGLPNLRLRSFPERRGKAPVLNDLIPAATGEIVVLSDANSFFYSDTVRQLVKHFQNPRVGAVCGELVLASGSWSVGGLGEGSYWAYENALKRMESDIRSTLGATGAVYAIRKPLFELLPTSKPVTDDFLIAAKIARKGFDIKYEPRARAYEKPSGSVAGEFTRKVRIGAANLHGLAEYWEMLGPRFGFIAWVLWSRKIIRWAVPFLLIAALLSSLMLAPASAFFRGVVIAEAIFIALAAAGLVLDRVGVKAGFFGFPYYFLAMNSALLVGAIRFVRGREPTTWKVVR